MFTHIKSDNLEKAFSNLCTVNLHLMDFDGMDHVALQEFTKVFNYWILNTQGNYEQD